MRTVLEPFGRLKLAIDGNEIDCDVIPMKTAEAARYAVDFRGKVVLPVPPSRSDAVVTCTLENEDRPVFEGGIDTGENLSAVTFDCDGHRVTIGTAGDLPDREYAYLSNGLSVVMRPCAQTREIMFCVAEKRLDGDADCVDPWLAVDLW